MRLNDCRRRLLASILVLHLLLLISACRVSAGFDFFKKFNEKKGELENKKEPGQQDERAKVKSGQVNARQESRDAADDETGSPSSRAAGGAKSFRRTDSLLESLNAVKNQQLNRRAKRPDLDKIREATEAQQRIESSELPLLPKRPKYSPGKEEQANKVQGQGRRTNKNSKNRADQEEEEEEEEELAEVEAGRRGPHFPRNYGRHHQEAESEQDEGEKDDEDEDEDDYDEEEEEAKRLERESEDSKFVSRFESKKIRDLAAAKFVSTLPAKKNKNKKGEKSDNNNNNNNKLKPNLTFLRPAKRGPGEEGEAAAAAAAEAEEKEASQRPAPNQLINGSIKKNKLITGSYWQKQLGKAYQVTKKGLKGSANFISELPKHVERGVDSINAFLQLDSKGKVLALIEETNGDAYFVRKEFSQFTLTWSPVMEKALDYLGDEHLDKLKWNDKDELDHRRDALHSLAFGYEFMRLMIVWRENLLIAHEAFKVWLESVKSEVEQKRVELDESLIIQLRTTHTYMLLVTWMAIEQAGQESRAKLDHLMEIEDDRPKNYESEYFRNIVVLQEMYEPTMQEFDRERGQVENSISDSGVVVENLQDVDDFFQSFRNTLVQHKVSEIDWEVPKELNDFMEKLEPQLRRSSLVYSKGFLNELGLRK